MYSRNLPKILIFIFLASTFILMNGFQTIAISKDALGVKRDEDKTTYSIGPSEKKNNEKTEEEKDKERAWDMLKNMNTVIDKREQNRQKNGQPGGK
jgi:hypothetical protein